MVARSQNGYLANRRSLIKTYTVPGTSVTLPIRKGPIHTVLLYVAARYDDEVERLHPGWCWGYAERTIRGSSTTLSNHASGTAIDLNAPAHPLGTDPRSNYSDKQIRAIHRIIGDCDGVVRWGGDYTGRKDGMHFEINAGPARVRRLARKLNKGDDMPSAKDIWHWDGIPTTKPDGKKTHWTPAHMLSNIEAGGDSANQKLNQVLARLKAQDATIDKLVDALNVHPVDIAALKQAIHDGIEQAVDSVDIELTTGKE